MGKDKAKPLQFSERERERERERGRERERERERFSSAMTRVNAYR
jgi:hypothetical protein